MIFSMMPTASSTFAGFGQAHGFSQRGGQLLILRIGAAVVGHCERRIELLNRLGMLALRLQRAAQGHGRAHFVIRPRRLRQLGVLLLGILESPADHQQVAHHFRRFEVVIVIRIVADERVELPPGIDDFTFAAQREPGGGSMPDRTRCPA